MGNVVFTLVLAFRADSARAHCLRVCKSFPRVHLLLGGASRITESLRSLGSSATGQGSLGLAEGRRASAVLGSRRVWGCVGTPRRDLWHLSPPKGGSGQPHPGGGTTGPGLLSQRKGPASRGDAGTRGGRGAGARVLGGCARPCAKAFAAAGGAGSRWRSSVLVTEQSWQRLSVFCRMRMFYT